jgi:hypothetical protein
MTCKHGNEISNDECPRCEAEREPLKVTPKSYAEWQDEYSRLLLLAMSNANAAQQNMRIYAPVHETNWKRLAASPSQPPWYRRLINYLRGMGR